MHADWITWLAVSLQLAFWVVDGAIMLRRGATVSVEIGRWEKGHLLRYLVVGLAGIFLTAHLLFFP